MAEAGFSDSRVEGTGVDGSVDSIRGRDTGDATSPGGRQYCAGCVLASWLEL